MHAKRQWCFPMDLKLILGILDSLCFSNGMHANLYPFTYWYKTLYTCASMGFGCLGWNEMSAPKGHFHTRDWEPVTITFQALSLVEKGGAGPSSFTLRLRDQRSMWKQDGCKVCMDSYMASNGSCFMATWIVLKKHLLEIGLPQNRETMALWTLTTIDFF
jgi:hypothetical protein